MASKTDVTKALMVLVAAYPNAKIVEGCDDCPGTLEVYATMLADIPCDELIAAIKYCINTHPDWMPSVATIRDAAGKLHSGGMTVSGMDAWGIVTKAIRDIGVYRSPNFSDPAISRAVEAIGWRNICLSDEQDFATRAQFIKAYEGYANRVKEENELLKIPEARRVLEMLGQRKQLALKGS